VTAGTDKPATDPSPGGNGGGELAAVVLAAGAGTRLRPLTERVPKALCPVDNRSLLDRALDRLADLGLSGPRSVAVNAHAHPEQLRAAEAGRAHLSLEQPVALGTAGALGPLRGWLGGRDVLICNADAYLTGSLRPLLHGWDRRRPRLLVVDDPDRGDFGRWRFGGASLLPGATAARIPPEPAGLYELVWREAFAAGQLELLPHEGTFIDCGTPADYLGANLHASGGRNVVGPGAQVEGTLVRSVVWPGGVVRAEETLIEAIRVGEDVTVYAAAAAGSPPPAATPR